MRLFFARFDEKHNLLESFEKIFENFPKKIAKNALFLHICQKNLTNHSLIFCAFGRKTKIGANFLREFSKIFKKILQKFAKMHYFSIFFNKINKPMRSFFAVWAKKHKLLGKFEKILKFFDENSIATLHFLIIFGKFVTKNRAF